MTEELNLSLKCECCGFSRVIEENPDMLECRRYPPSAFPMQAANQITGEVSVTPVSLPVFVNREHCCGEFKNKI